MAHNQVDDAKGLDTFAILLTRCSSMSGESASEMNQPSVIRGVMQKLPTQLQDRLRREVVGIHDTGRRVVLDDIVRFVDNEARIALDLLYGKLSTTQSHKNMPSETAVKKQLGYSCLATGVTEGQRKTYKCWCCEGEHLLDDCSLFQEKSTMEKRQFMMDNRLCFGCLRQGHRVAGCKSKKFCKTCKGRHPTVLHEERQTSSKQTEPHRVPEGVTKAGAVEVIAGASRLQSSMSVVPVKVRVGGGRTVSTYAFFDNGSSATFCTQSLLHVLDVKTVEPTQLSLCTVDPEVTRVDSHIVTGMEVSNMNETEFIELPPVYIQ